MMMFVVNEERYAAHRKTPWKTREIILAMVLFSGIGGITWAVRGSNGWDGVQGTIIPGMTWGILWYYLCWRKGIDARLIPLWLGLGIALGGELGYGIYTGWIVGKFPVDGTEYGIAPWWGHLWFIICGIGWGAPGAIALGWALGGKGSMSRWFVRLFLPAGAAYLAWVLVMAWPAPFVPHFHTGLWPDALRRDWPRTLLVQTGNLLVVLAADAALIVAAFQRENGPVRKWLVPLIAPFGAIALFFLFFCMQPSPFFSSFWGAAHVELEGIRSRILYTQTQNFVVLAWFAGAMLTALLQRDKNTLVVGALVGLGFGPGFWVSALWCYGYKYAPSYIDWWKVWELHSGVNLGMCYALAMYWAIRQMDKHYDAEGNALVEIPEIPVWRKDLSLLTGIVLLVGITCYGLTSRLGVLVGLYSDADVGQYEFPWGRVLLFVPMVLIMAPIFGFKLVQIIQRAKTPDLPPTEPHALQERMVDLFTGLALVGAITIWPEKIGVLYALFLAVTLFAFMRLHAPASSRRIGP